MSDPAETPTLNCPLCGVETADLVAIDSGLRLGMQNDGVPVVPTEVCRTCLKDWRKKISKGVQIKATQEVKKTLKQDLWANRLKFVRQARNLFTNKVYGESAACYEKYLKILEVVHDVGKDKLSPAHFKEQPKEITLICSVYWDLMLIYDADIKLKEKQESVGERLAEFSKYTPMLSALIRKADIERRRARNPQVFKDFLKACNAKVSRCFIASAAFDSHYHPTVRTLCLFRDQSLRPYPWGRRLIYGYYWVSPNIAQMLDRAPGAKKLCRIVLRPLAFILKHTFRLQQ